VRGRGRERRGSGEESGEGRVHVLREIERSLVVSPGKRRRGTGEGGLILWRQGPLTRRQWRRQGRDQRLLGQENGEGTLRRGRPEEGGSTCRAGRGTD
jgi:hypothetical protein